MESSLAMPQIAVASKHKIPQIGKVLRLQKLEAALLTQLNDAKARLAQNILPQIREKTLTQPCSRRYIRTWLLETMLRYPLSANTRLARSTGLKWLIGWSKLQHPSSVLLGLISSRLLSSMSTSEPNRALKSWRIQTSTESALLLCTSPPNMRTSTLFTPGSSRRRSHTTPSPRRVS